MVVFRRNSRYREALGKGIRCPPCSFNLVGEFLHLLLDKAMNLGFFQGLKLKDGHILSHVEYADVTILFFDKSLLSCKGIKMVIYVFQMLMGLEINFCKSTLYASNPNSHLMRECAEILGCNCDSWPFTYVGCTVGASPTNRKFWCPVIKKFRTKLSHWKSYSLNKAGRGILIKSVLYIFQYII